MDFNPSNNYIAEIKVKHKWKMILFYATIIIISIGILLTTFWISYKYIINPTDKDEINTPSGVTTAGVDQEKEKEEEKPKEEQPIIKNTFPKHDINKAIAGLFPQYNDKTQEKVRGIYSSDEKQVFLTFDDGPSNVTPKILDILKENDVKATFFVLGNRVDLKPEITKRAYEEGHYIANHGYTHSYSTIYQSPQNVLNEYNQTENSIKNAIGQKQYNSHLFRFPGGSSGGKYKYIKSDAIQLLNDNQIAYTNWNCLTGDAEGKKTKEEMFNYLIETTGDKNSLVILMHDAGDKQVTAEVLPDIIKYFKDRGYVFKNYYDIMK